MRPETGSVCMPSDRRRKPLWNPMTQTLGSIRVSRPAEGGVGREGGVQPVKGLSRPVGRCRKGASPGIALGVASILILVIVFFPEGILGARPPHGTMTSVCENANLKSDPASVVASSSGEVRFACAFTPALVPAFTVGGLPPGRFVKAQATLTGFVGPYASLWIYDARDNTARPCGDRDGHLQIPSGKTLKILTGDWNYCAEFLNAGQAGLPAFSVSWTVS